MIWYDINITRYKQLIVPPSCVKVKWVGLKGTRQRHLIVRNVQHPNIPDWTPLIVIGNRKSGNNDGELILRHFRTILNTPQVCYGIGKIGYWIWFISPQFNQCTYDMCNIKLVDMGWNVTVTRNTVVFIGSLWTEFGFKTKMICLWNH